MDDCFDKATGGEKDFGSLDEGTIVLGKDFASRLCDY